MKIFRVICAVTAFIAFQGCGMALMAAYQHPAWLVVVGGFFVGLMAFGFAARPVAPGCPWLWETKEEAERREEEFRRYQG